MKASYSVEDLYLLLQGAWGYHLFSFFFFLKYKALIFWTIKQYEFELYKGRFISNSTLLPKSKDLLGFHLNCRGLSFIIPFLRLALGFDFCVLLLDKQNERSNFSLLATIPKVKSTFFFFLVLYFPLFCPDNSVTL